MRTGTRLRPDPAVPAARRWVVALLVCVFAASTFGQPAPTKQCETARRKIDREQKSIAAAADTIARDRHARESCTSRVLCSRLDASIESAERRKTRHEARLARFRQEVAQECGG